MENNFAPVIIIGAGIAGLSAAHHLQKNGIQVLVLEAQARIGGRIKSTNFNGVLFELRALRAIRALRALRALQMM